jgi:hypothetical protein
VPQQNRKQNFEKACVSLRFAGIPALMRNVSTSDHEVLISGIGLFARLFSTGLPYQP